MLDGAAFLSGQSTQEGSSACLCDERAAVREAIGYQQKKDPSKSARVQIQRRD